MKQIKGYPNYCITLDGRLFSLNTMKFIKANYDKDGYVFYRMSNKSKEFQRKAHRLVAMTYLPNLQNKSDVNHIDGKKDNNIIFNLEWSTKSENAKHAWNTGLQNRYRAHAKQVVDTSNGVVYRCVSDAAKAIGMKYGLLKNRLRGKTNNNTSLKYI